MNINYQKLIFAFEEWSKEAKANNENINICREEIASLRQKIKGCVKELAQQDYNDASDERAELDAARSVAVEMDCNFLRQQLSEMEGHVKSKNTEVALRLLEPVQMGVELLKLRLQYISHLERLIKLYKNEIGFREDFRQLESILTIKRNDGEVSIEKPGADSTLSDNAEVLFIVEQMTATSIPSTTRH